MNKITFKIIILCMNYVSGFHNITGSYDVNENFKMDVITTLLINNLQANGRHTLLFIGIFPDIFYQQLNHLPLTFTTTDIYNLDEQIEDVVPYHSNTIVLNCVSFEQFEKAMFKLVTLPYWHPLANIILHFSGSHDSHTTAKIFFAFWYYRAINAVIVQQDHAKIVHISYYNPYMSEFYRLEHIFGCWTARKIQLPIYDFTEFICTEGCHNVSLYSNLRTNNLGTCIGFQTYSIEYSEKESVKKLRLFEDKSINYNKFPMRAHAIGIMPFLVIKEVDGKYTLHQRDGKVWNTIAALMNFTIDLSPSKHLMQLPFKYETNIIQVYAFSLRKIELLIFPLYQFDIMIIDNDNTVPIVDSGVCILAHRAGFETIVFDHKLLLNNIGIITEFFICFLCTWITFIIFNIEQYGCLSFDQVGRDLVNSFRTVLSISLHNPPRRRTFRIFFVVAIWCFFLVNFTSQAAIISLFSIYKKGKEVDTFEQVLAKGYNIEGISSPDVVLPDDEERFRNINSKMVAVQNMFTCPMKMLNDSRRFCILDCALGRYLERNLLNEKGKQYLHVARQDRIHSHYLQMILPRHSPMTRRFNRYIQILFEAGIINKWIEFRYDDIKEEPPVKALGMNDIEGILKCYCILLMLCMIVFVIEFLLGIIARCKLNCRLIRKRVLTRKTFRIAEINSLTPTI